MITQDIMCDCRKVRLRLHGACEASTICHCAECQTAAVVFRDQFDRNIAEPGGGTTFGIWRKDRVECVMGADHLAGHRLVEESPSRRVIATCCDTPMFIDRKGRPWIGVFSDRFPDDRRPQPRWRTFCKDLADEPRDGFTIPRHSGYSLPLATRRWKALLATRFNTAHLTFVTRDL